jgi:hypothetical protein
MTADGSRPPAAERGLFSGWLRAIPPVTGVHGGDRERRA